MSSYVWITQYVGGNEDLREIARLGHTSAASVASTFGQLERIFDKADGLTPGGIYVERVIDDELIDGAVLVPMRQVEWLLCTFFKLPACTMRLVRKRPVTTPTGAGKERG